jgi:hypothetical protein
MRTLTNTKATKVAGSIALWFVVFLILAGGGLSFEDGRWAMPGALLLALAVALTAWMCVSRRG